VNKQLVAVLLGVLGVLLFSTKAVFVKLAYQYEVDALSLLLLRMCFALPFYVLMVFLSKSAVPIKKSHYLYIFLAGFLGYYMASYLDFQGLRFIKASVERLVLFTYPTLVILLSFLFLGKRAQGRQLVAIVVSYLGIAVVFLPELDLSGSDKIVLGATLVFFSGLCYAAYIVSSSWIIPQIGAKLFTSYCMTVSCLLVIIHFSFADGNFLSVLSLPTEVYVYGLLMAIISTIVPSYLISYALQDIGANRFAILGSLGPISTILLAYIFLGEKLFWQQWLGGVLVVFGVLYGESQKSVN